MIRISKIRIKKKMLSEQAIALGDEHAFIMVPTQFKFPKGVIKWQDLTNTHIVEICGKKLLDMVL